MRLFLVLFFCGLAGFAAAATPDAITPDGGRYFGPLVGGRMHGRGRLEYANGGWYEGEFAEGLLSGRGKARFATGSTYDGEWKNGMMAGRGRFEVPGREVYEGEFREDYYWGKGKVRYLSGRTGVYAGDFVRGEWHGRGRAEMTNGEVYEGDFRKGEFTGNGVHTRKDGSRYEGEFSDWTYHGRGRYQDGRGGSWEGRFVRGELDGRGKSKTAMGEYEGDFKAWQPHGRGVLKLPNGDVYDGEFENSMYHGRGTMTYAAPRPDGSKRDSGAWSYGRFDVEAAREKARANVETALYAQKELLDKALASLKPREAGRINLWLLAVGGDGSQEVFRREVEYVQKDFAQRFGTAGRSLALVNSRTTVSSLPMATLTSVRAALQAIAARMDREEDILFLFLTSHGSRDHEFVLSQTGMQLQGLRAQALAGLLKETGIKWKVVVVSACYSGGFIDPLQDGRSLILTAARRDRRSFGCADENDFTHFGRAFFKESLPRATSFQDAFRKAEVLVGEWERKDVSGAAGAKADAGEEQSLPQISSNRAIEGQLNRWWAQLAR